MSKVLFNGKRLKEIRAEKGLSQKKLAEKTSLHIITIGNYEIDRREPKATQLKLLADALGVKMEEFFQGPLKERSVNIMPTYREIRKEVEENTGRQISHTCWIAEVKRHHGLTRGPAPNTGTGKGAPPCPEWAWQAVEQVLKARNLI